MAGERADDAQRVLTDVVAQANAGAALANAIYYSNAEFVLAMPDPVARAYARACAAFGIGK